MLQGYNLQQLNRTVTGPRLLIILLWIPEKSISNFLPLTQFSYLVGNVRIILSSGTVVSGILQWSSASIPTPTFPSSLCIGPGSYYRLLNWLSLQLLASEPPCSAQSFIFLHTYISSQATQGPTILQSGSWAPSILLTLALWTQHVPLN